MKYSLIIILLTLSTLSCKQDNVDNDVYITFTKPINFPEPTYQFENNKFSQNKFELGKKLFFEGKLSSDNTISCGSCHDQKNAFTHHGHALSDGVGGVTGTRNTQPIQNLAFMNEFTWDGAVRHLDLQPIIPIESELEMKESVSNVLLKLKSDINYVNLFNKSFVKTDFEDHVINLRTLMQALSIYMNSLVSANSRYDKYIRGEYLEEPYSDDEKKGLMLFKEKCASCHSGELFTDQSYRNNGIGVNNNLPNELGRGRVVDEDNGVNGVDYYKFKVPSLRNIWVTYPYMHDGRMSSLEDVLNHYSNGVKEMRTLDPSLKNGDVLGIPLSEIDKKFLTVFMKSLTDYEFLNDERFAEN